MRSGEGRTRREFLSQAALAAAAAGLGPGVLTALANQDSSRAYRDLAVRCAQWIDRSAQVQSSGTAWPAVPLKPASIGLDYYNGMPGIVAFYANLFHATGDLKWRDRARQGAEYLRAELRKQSDAVDCGLYTGLAGIGAMQMALDTTKVTATSGDAAKSASMIVARAKSVGHGVEWSDSNDIISGTAGIGLFLLAASKAWKEPTLTDLAAKAGRRLIQTAEASNGGLMWFPSASLHRNYPNFSHGTAGVAYFLATLYQRTNDRAFLDAAMSGAIYLDAIATRRDGARAIFHQSDGGENRFYLSWCHGPVGTARLYRRLAEIWSPGVGLGDTKTSVVTADAYGNVIVELARWIDASGAPEKQSDGYWNNISQCCGNVGIGQFMIDLERHGRLGTGIKASTMRYRIASNTMSRAMNDRDGLRWVQAENRTQPENRVAQTGFMQGAAGVGSFFLQLDAFSRGEEWPTPWPDTPW